MLYWTRVLDHVFVVLQDSTIIRIWQIYHL